MTLMQTLVPILLHRQRNPGLERSELHMFGATMLQSCDETPTLGRMAAKDGVSSEDGDNWQAQGFKIEEPRSRSEWYSILLVPNLRLKAINASIGQVLRSPSRIFPDS